MIQLNHFDFDQNSARSIQPIGKNERPSAAAIVEDLLATGGTVNCVSNLIESNDKEVMGLLVVVELIRLEARSKLDFPIESSITF